MLYLDASNERYTQKWEHQGGDKRGLKTRNVLSPQVRFISLFLFFLY